MLASWITAVENQLNFTKFCLSSTEQSAALTNQRFSLRLSFPSSSLSVNSSPDFSSVRYELFVSEDTHAIHVIRIARLGPALIGYDDPSEIQSPSLYARPHADGAGKFWCRCKRRVGVPVYGSYVSVLFTPLKI